MSEAPPEYPECRLTEMGKEYIPWAPYHRVERELLRSIRDTEQGLEGWNLKLDWNYCRNPGFRKRPWCFVSYEDLSWEYCNIPLCKSPNDYT
ncbi:unnamed protein product [Darwinula stevensoni]|uniref:Kringle domain-containing protein n=1 Tax=Darwinula stevensoni TaxID=69355 RepID=A0A7R8XM82_9CRUS|nr:unnamed protein product [Darwinula stevensoni]CAG0895274.1 unnamed protein product [Darwinula stevensoni]